MGLIYEVNVTVKGEIAARYSQWLKGHVERMLQLPAFTKARICRVEDPRPPEGSVCFCIQYETKNLAALKAYFATEAPRMRAEAESEFAGQFSAQRRWMEVL